MTNEVIVIGDTIYISYNGKSIRRPIWLIHFIESFKHTCLIYFDLNKPETAQIGIHDLIKMLPPAYFEMVHKQYIIHLAIMLCATLTAETIEYKGHSIPVARRQRKNFDKNLQTYFKSNPHYTTWLMLLCNQIAKEKKEADKNSKTSKNNPDPNPTIPPSI